MEDFVTCCHSHKECLLLRYSVHQSGHLIRLLNSWHRKYCTEMGSLFWGHPFERKHRMFMSSLLWLEKCKTPENIYKYHERWIIFLTYQYLAVRSIPSEKHFWISSFQLGLFIVFLTGRILLLSCLQQSIIACKKQISRRVKYSFSFQVNVLPIQIIIN